MDEQNDNPLDGVSIGLTEEEWRLQCIAKTKAYSDKINASLRENKLAKSSCQPKSKKGFIMDELKEKIKDKKKSPKVETRGGQNAKTYQQYQQYFRDLFFQSLDPAKIEKIYRRLQDDAVAGCPKATAMLASYMIGLPPKHIEANINSTSLTPEQTQKRVNELLGLESTGGTPPLSDA